MAKIVPPILWFFCIFLSVVISKIALIPLGFPNEVRWVGAFVFLVGFGLSANAVRTFIRMETEIHTFRTPVNLTTGGLFRFSRNPIYLGQTLALVGLVVFVDSAVSFITPVLFWSACNFHYIPFEENNLEKTFGGDYLDYKASVRRWI